MPAVEDQLRERLQSLQALQKANLPPYPYVNLDTIPVQEIHQHYAQWEGKEVTVAGRLIARRIMGKVTFIDLEDRSGTIQLYIQRDILCPDEDKTLYQYVVKKWLDLGDILSATGKVFRTRTGEISIQVHTIQLLAKALRPPPIPKRKGEQEFSALRDPETRYRQRYLDLLAHRSVREKFILRTRMIQAIRQFLDSQGFLEVETPILHTVYGGAHARPFRTHLHALDLPLYLRISNELYLKRLLIGGLEKVYEFSRDFRNEGIDRTHHPEFTMLELYVAYRDYHWMAEFTEQLIAFVLQQTRGTLQLTYQGKIIDFTPPWRRITYFGALREATGQDLRNASDTQIRELAEKSGISVEQRTSREKVVDKLFEHFVQRHLQNPTLVLDFPVEISPLARKHREDPTLAERFELICAGMELANAYTEQNVPWEQREALLRQQQLRTQGEEEAMPYDEDFLVAMEYGMPPMAGLGIGIDRLAMLLTDSPAIQEVLFFPLLRPVPAHSYAPPIPYESLLEPDSRSEPQE